mgnify:CR=1 FL=1
MNECNAEKIAVDIPSGVFGDGGRDETSFVADFTVTFIAYKPCFFLPETVDLFGEVKLLDIGVPVIDYAYSIITAPHIRKRPKNSHKGTYGTALLLCGSYGMCGAEVLAARAALRSGVGLVKAIVCDKNYTAFCQSVPEAVTIPVPTLTDGTPEVFDRTILSATSSSNALLLGCGLGSSDEAKRIVKNALLISKIPVIVDADGINAIASDINILRKTKAPVILTPHPKEMSRMTGLSVAEIERNRMKIAKKFAIDYGCILVLKGANTVVAAPDGRVFINNIGNPGMATGGSGDVLSGIIASFVSQGMDTFKSAIAGVYIHGLAGDDVTEKYSMMGNTPTLMLNELPTTLKKFE